jgi:signal transduction histidine kinase
VAVILAVLLALPLKRRLERVANRVVYGHSADPRATLSALRNRLDAVAEGEDIVGTSLEALVASLPLSAASVSVPGARWACGSDDANEVDATFALTFRGESLGVLSVRALPGARLRTADRATLEGVARQFALVVQMQRLTDDLLRSRARLVATREEERRRLSHDLHDSLGPGLAALGLQAHQARSVLWSDPARAGEILDHISQGTRDAVADVRAIASGLATPEVERLGIVGAIPLLIARFRTDGFNVTLTTNMTEADELPAEIELAAYLVTAEALANSARHAQASTCLVNVCLNGHLEVSVTDDGVGLPPNPTVGVGLASMRARVEACTGRFEVGPGDGGGTRIRALLPVAERV